MLPSRAEGLYSPAPEHLLAVFCQRLEAFAHAPFSSFGEKGESRFILGDQVGHEWVVSQGVKPGERVIVEGAQKVRQGMQVKPRPFLAQGKGE